MGKILERHKLPTLIQDKVDSPNRSTRDWASDQKTFNKQSPGPSLMTSTRCLRKINTNLSYTLPKK